MVTTGIGHPAAWMVTLALLSAPSPYRYRVVDIAEIGFAPSLHGAPALHGTVSVNDLGQVVYTRAAGDGHNRAWVYLPVPAFGQPRGVTDLPGADESAAWDINIAGQIVGQVGGSERGSGEAVLWQLGPMIETVRLGFLPNAPEDAWSVAYALNDFGLIVGDAIQFDGPLCQSVQRGFRLWFNDPLPPLEPLGPADGDGLTTVRDVSNPFYFGPFIIPSTMIGFSHEGFACNPSQCENSKNALYWQLQTIFTLDGLSPQGGFEGHGLTPDLLMVGFARVLPPPPLAPPGSGGCPNQALFWGNPPVNLGALPGMHPGEESRAIAINRREKLDQVVGWSDEALLWERDETLEWQPVRRLNELIDPGNGWYLHSAHQVNDEGCIAGVGTLNDTEHVFLLYENCPCDCDGHDDAVVDVLDLLALLAQWGGAGPCDTDGDGSVGMADAMTLLVSWGPCCRTKNKP